MAYIGRQISGVSDRAVLDNITTSATATYNLLLNSVAYVPSSAESLTVSLNGVIQKPQSSYTVSGSTIVFDSALTSSDSIDFILAERAITLTTVGSGSVGLNQLSATGTKDATTFLRGDNTFATIESGIAWQSSIKTSSFTAVANEGYWVDTSSNTVTITLPSSASVGDTIELVDYARTWGTNKIIIDSNGLNYQGSPDTYAVEYDTSGQALRIVYSGATKGWIPTSDDAVVGVVYDVDFLIIAGGGGGGSDYGSGGGAGGYRASFNSETSGGGGSSESALSVEVGTQYTVTVGAGGTGGRVGIKGSDSVFSSVTSIGGGFGTGEGTGTSAGSGGSGGGGMYNYVAAGSGTANQGFDGGTTGSGSPYTPAGGGGAGAVGGNGTSSSAGDGGNGVASTITGSSVTRAGGGGGGFSSTDSRPAGAGGSGGGGAGGATQSASGSAGTTNTGSGGGGGGGDDASNAGGNGGSGIVILRMATAKYTGTTTGSPSVTTSGSDTILTYTGSGSYTA